MRPHHHDAIGEHDRLVDIMRHHDERRLEIGPQVEKVILQIGAGEGVECGEWLIEQKNLRPRHQCACNGDALGLPAGEFARPHPRLLGQTDAIERARHARPAFRLRVLR